MYFAPQKKKRKERTNSFHISQIRIPIKNKTLPERWRPTRQWDPTWAPARIAQQAVEASFFWKQMLYGNKKCLETGFLSNQSFFQIKIWGAMLFSFFSYMFFFASGGLVFDECRCLLFSLMLNLMHACCKHVAVLAAKLMRRWNYTGWNWWHWSCLHRSNAEKAKECQRSVCHTQRVEGWETLAGLLCFLSQRGPWKPRSKSDKQIQRQDVHWAQGHQKTNFIKKAWWLSNPFETYSHIGEIDNVNK